MRKFVPSHVCLFPAHFSVQNPWTEAQFEKALISIYPSKANKIGASCVTKCVILLSKVSSTIYSSLALDVYVYVNVTGFKILSSVHGW